MNTEQIWEPFLTDQDREHLAHSGWKKEGLFGFGTNPALLVIDDYYSVLGLDREPLMESVKKWPMSCGLAGWEAIDRTAELIAVAREHDIPVIYVRGLPGFPSPWGKGQEQRRPSTELLSESERSMGNEIVAEIAPEPGDVVIQKAAASSFHGTPLLFHLNALRIDTVIACGETTSGCVRASVVDGATFRFRMGVVAEACFDRTEASHAMILFDMDTKYADVIDIPFVTEYFASVSGKVPATA